MNSSPFPQPRPMIPVAYDKQVDVDRLWEYRENKKLQHLVIQHFYSPNIHPLVIKRLKKKYKEELLKSRRQVRKIRNLRRNLRSRRRMTLVEVLDDPVNVSDILSIINTYVV
jgi:hypothetical protein